MKSVTKNISQFHTQLGVDFTHVLFNTRKQVRKLWSISRREAGFKKKIALKIDARLRDFKENFALSKKSSAKNQYKKVKNSALYK